MVAPNRKRSRLTVALFLGLQCWLSSSFLTITKNHQGGARHDHKNKPASSLPFSSTIQRIPQQQQQIINSPQRSTSSSTTARNVWWYGGSESVEPVEQDSCELVAVRIERTSANSRRIYGEITVPAPLRDVWAILTDYDRLAIHVPNLVESRIVDNNNNNNRRAANSARAGGEKGDGQFQCRLYQKGAQKIVGFEFGASVTMDMKEIIVERFDVGRDRKITFKCVDSFFFSEFDGAWEVKERRNDSTGEVETLLSYVVDVRPKGPVPVAALEWRIREDVPTNLRAVKKAALESGYEGVMAVRGRGGSQQQRTMANGVPSTAGGGALAKIDRVKVQWYKDETMAAYLKDQH